jgi:hypothetical protein
MYVYIQINSNTLSPSIRFFDIDQGLFINDVDESSVAVPEWVDFMDKLIFFDEVLFF